MADRADLVLSTRHLVDPELAPLIDLMPSDAVCDANLADVRAFAAQTLADTVPAPDTSCTTLHFPGGRGQPDVEALLYRPTDATEGSLPLFLHIHGGGFVAGSPEMVAADDHSLARTLRCAVLTPRYRLAPETPYPGALEDCYAALRGASARADELGLDPRRIAIGGESAGGGLAAALGLLARDRGEVPILFQLLIFPMLDDRTGTKADDANHFAGEFAWTRESNIYGWGALLGERADPDVPPYAAPARCENLTGLPPTFLYTGALDLFVDENIAFAHALIRAGVPTEFHIYPGAIHGFRLCREARVSQQADAAAFAALARAFDAAGRPGGMTK